MPLNKKKQGGRGARSGQKGPKTSPKRKEREGRGKREKKEKKGRKRRKKKEREKRKKKERKKEKKRKKTTSFAIDVRARALGPAQRPPEGKQLRPPPGADFLSEGFGGVFLACPLENYLGYHLPTRGNLAFPYCLCPY